jgi:hypothetical protein
VSRAGRADHRDRRARQCHGAAPAGRRGTQVTVTQPEGRRSVTRVRPYRTVTVPGAACGGSGPAAAATAGCGGGHPDRTVPGSKCAAAALATVTQDLRPT